MPFYPIYTALNLPTVISFPSSTSLQWSPDGQICFVTKSTAYLLTPDHGINFDNESVIKSPVKQDGRNEDHQTLGWFRTMVQDSKPENTRWPEYSQAWGAIALGSIDVSIWDIAFSPTDVSSDGRSTLAMLSSNMDVTLWRSGKNYLKGEWFKAADVTPLLIQEHTPEGDQPSTASILKAQTTCLTWTTQPAFGVFPSPVIDGSLLILGNRGGCITLLRYIKRTLKHIETIHVTDTWTAQLSFSGWRRSEEAKCEGYIAYGTYDGSVGLLKITQNLHHDQFGFSFVPKFSIEVTSENGSDLIFNPDSAGITALRWIYPPDRTPILVVCKPGIVKLWSFSTSQQFWSGRRTLFLQTQKISKSASAFHPVSGIVYIRHQDVLVISLFDGSLHALHNVSVEPSWDIGSGLCPTSKTLSDASRAVFMKTERGSVDSNVMNRITGLTNYDNGFTLLWAYEASIPSDFSYKHDAKHNSMVVAAQIWEEQNEDHFFEDLEELLNTMSAAPGVAPLHALRPFFFHLYTQRKLTVYHDRVLQILKARFDDHSTNIHVPKLTIPLTDELRQEFRRSLSSHLFGWDVLISLRMRLSLADFLWKFSDNEDRQRECGLVAQSILNTISHRTLRTIIRHLISVVDVITENDIPFVLRMVIQSLLPGSPPDLSEEGNDLSSMVEYLIPKDSAGTSISNELSEVCPACQVAIPLEDITTAVCPNGHTWARCSITTFLLTTPSVRTCVGCSRKAFLPPSNCTAGQSRLPYITQGWVVAELLEAVNRCLFCNNSFVEIL